MSARMSERMMWKHATYRKITGDFGMNGVLVQRLVRVSEAGTDLIYVIVIEILKLKHVLTLVSPKPIFKHGRRIATKLILLDCTVVSSIYYH